jgi:hypothetical protein
VGMSLTQSKVNSGLDSMQLDKRYPVPPGSLQMIENYMRSHDWDGGIQLNFDKSEFYKILIPEI